MRIRSITVFTELSPTLEAAPLQQAGEFANAARQAYQAAGFDVQTTRLATHVLPALAASSQWAAQPAAFATALEAACRDYGFEYISLGPASSEIAPRLPEILAATQSVFATLHIVDPQSGVIDGKAIRAAAEVIREAATIENGFGNLRFAALANVPASTPFFPAAYHGGGAPAFAIAVESADLAVAACRQAQNAEEARQQLSAAIEIQAAAITEVASRLSEAHALPFKGIDFSLAPFPAPEISIGAALELLSGEPLGGVGTLSAAATLTDAIGQARFLHVGFNGLMLPVLEDPVLGQRAAEGRLHIGELLQWSAVCGTGLDTVPLPGDVSQAALQRVLFDVAALSSRLHKPLTARLMPLPGKIAGDPVHFDFAYFADGGVLALDGEGNDGKLLQSDNLSLHPYTSAL